MNTLQFEAIKVALKQDKTGYVLTLCLHPDEIPEDLLRDFVGARYQVVMVRLNVDEQPMDRQSEFEGERSIRVAGLLCRDKSFWDYLADEHNVFGASEEDTAEWLRDHLSISSRTELKINPEARAELEKIHKEFKAWKQKS